MSRLPGRSNLQALRLGPRLPRHHSRQQRRLKSRQRRRWTEVLCRPPSRLRMRTAPASDHIGRTAKRVGTNEPGTRSCVLRRHDRSRRSGPTFVSGSSPLRHSQPSWQSRLRHGGYATIRTNCHVSLLRPRAPNRWSARLSSVPTGAPILRPARAVRWLIPNNRGPRQRLIQARPFQPLWPHHR